MAGGAPNGELGGGPALEARLARDEARIEVEEAEVRETRIIAWSGLGLAVAVIVAVTALILSVIALSEDVGMMRRDTPAGSVGTASLRDGAVTQEKLATADGRADRDGQQAPGRTSVARLSLRGRGRQHRQRDRHPPDQGPARRPLPGGSPHPVRRRPHPRRRDRCRRRARTWQLVVSAVCADGGE